MMLGATTPGGTMPGATMPGAVASSLCGGYGGRVGAPSHSYPGGARFRPMTNIAHFGPASWLAFRLALVVACVLGGVLIGWCLRIGRRAFISTAAGSPPAGSAYRLGHPVALRSSRRSGSR